MEPIRVAVRVLKADLKSVGATVQMTVTPEVLFELNRTREVFSASGGAHGQKFYYRFCDPPAGLYRVEFSQGTDGQLIDQPGLWTFFVRAVTP